MTLPWVLAIALIAGVAAIGVAALVGVVLILLRPPSAAGR